VPKEASGYFDLDAEDDGTLRFLLRNYDPSAVAVLGGRANESEQ